MYQHRDWQGMLLGVQASKVLCVGNSYADHIYEMGGKPVVEPVLFIKPETALCNLKQPIIIPKDYGLVHHEVELAILIGMNVKQVNEACVVPAIAGYGVALDLTLRDVSEGV